MCTAEPIPERPAYVPSWLWAALYDSKAYPSLNPDDFIVVNGKNIYIGFHYTTGYTFDCDMGSSNDDGNRGMGCLGYMPTMGALPLTRSTYPIPSNNHRIFTRVVMSENSHPVRVEAPAYAVDDGFYDNTPHFPAGHRLYIPEIDPPTLERTPRLRRTIQPRSRLCLQRHQQVRLPPHRQPRLLPRPIRHPHLLVSSRSII
ncbi:MAG: hypothetical protein U1U88_001110 [Lawsonella clevelandensis]